MSRDPDHLHRNGGRIDAHFVERQEVHRMLDAVVAGILLKHGEPLLGCRGRQRLNVYNETRLAPYHRRQFHLGNALWQRMRACGDGDVYMCIPTQGAAHRLDLDPRDRLTSTDVDLLNPEPAELNAFETEERGHASEAVLNLHFREPADNNNVAVFRRTH
ncbi:hypothetical protein AGR2A_Cc140085 [Agrobacterium genomosp. 2 str. CFBP 5494]|uniref:Uncharacterized protein n=1 Tax=Agrobacterium genomosp. 2 str. CFBP 5494 TaxID=1183436 RepID=A0A9W5AZX5_9HYPH|nr:hypothetical protein AGR2A_Cc140085 [Agrobacterium genomosp. 2 str. CFBP 5494]